MLKQAVYVLTTRRGDYYYQQFMISVTSLKKYIPSIAVSVLVDSDSYQTFDDDRKEIFKVANVIQINIPTGYSQKEKSRQTVDKAGAGDNLRHHFSIPCPIFIQKVK